MKRLTYQDAQCQAEMLSRLWDGIYPLIKPEVGEEKALKIVQDCLNSFGKAFREVHEREGLD